MAYIVNIRNNRTGEVRAVPNDMTWDESSHFWWTQGNFGCDCNRAWEFARGVDPNATDPGQECGNEAFTVTDAILPDGRVVKID